MEYTWEKLHKMRVSELREIASTLEDEEIKGYTQLKKDDLLPRLCHALGIEDHAHHEVVGLDKTTIKQNIRKWKIERDQALDSKDKEKLKHARREIHHLKVKLRHATR
jgi:hypothetical protein